jgi:hypothetical protein
VRAWWRFSIRAVLGGGFVLYRVGWRSLTSHEMIDMADMADTRDCGVVHFRSRAGRYCSTVGEDGVGEKATADVRGGW